MPPIHYRIVRCLACPVTVRFKSPSVGKSDTDPQKKMPGSAFERSIVPKAEVQQTEDDLFRKKNDHQGRLGNCS